MKKTTVYHVLRQAVLRGHLLLAGFILSTLLLSGCATGPQVAQAAPTIAINTIPAGADISVGGNYVGQSPVSIPMPSARVDMGAYYKLEYRADQPLQIQAQLAGHETKDVTFGVYHAPQDQVVQPVFSYSAVTKTTPGYYTFENQITIKLVAKSTPSSN